VLVLAFACATPQTDALLEQGLPAPARIELREIPHHPQQQHRCGPASLAAVLNGSGDPVSPEELAGEVYSPGRRGTLQTSLVAAARRHGRVAYPVSDLPSLLTEVGHGNPVLVLQKLGIGWYPVWHYAVVIGYDLDRRIMLLRSGQQARKEQPLRVFERTWTRGGSWGLVVLDPSELPASAEEQRYLSAVVGLESAGRPEASVRAYRTALSRWPRSVGAWIGLGNGAYASGDLPAAERAFRAATRLDPSSAAAFNNLAHVLAEQGRESEALAAAREAVRLGGVQVDLYRETLREIEQRPSDLTP
jgi:hypothetical protein